MKKFLSVILALLMMLACIPSVFAAEGDTVVLFTNDVHCSVADYAVLAAYRAELIAGGSNVVTIDAGDAIQGEYIGSHTKGESIVTIMNAAGYDFAVPGNHEFDYGMDVFLDLAENKAEYEYISSNFTSLVTLETVFEPYRIVDVNDELQIAFIGITTPESVTKSTPEFFKDENGNYIYGFPTFDMADDILCETVQNSVDNAKADGADIVVAVAHLGIDGTTDGWKSTDVIAHTNGIDYFIDAHSHETFDGDYYENKDGEKVLLASTGTKFNNFGVITISADGETTVNLVSPDDIDIDTLSDEAKSAYNYVSAIINGFEAEIEYLYEPVGISEANLKVYEENNQWLVRRSETNTGDFVTDAYRALTGADIAICNSGGIRSEIGIGTVTRMDLMKINPWDKDMCIAELTGQQILDALEHSVRSYPGYSGGFLQVSGIEFEVHAWKTSPVNVDVYGNFVSIDSTLERRVANAKIAGEPIDPEKTYTVASTTYVLTLGGDGLTMFQGAKMLEKEGLACDSAMLVEYFTENLGGVITAEQYGNATGDGRIKIIESEPVTPDDNVNNESENGFMSFINKIIELIKRIITFISDLFE